jgi:uncharacterized protein YegL
MPKWNRCEIVVLLDRSGSMSSIADDMRGGFDAFVVGQRAVPGECGLTLVQFDTQSIDTLYENRPIAQVPPLELHPRGGTPLLDALGATILRTGERFRVTAESERPGRILFVTITDGQENESKQYTKPQVRSMIEHQTNVYKWEFTFLGANMDAFGEAQQLGIRASAVSNYTPDKAGVRAAFVGLNSAATAYRSAAPDQTAAFVITDDQRQKMGSPPAPTNLVGTP